MIPFPFLVVIGLIVIALLFLLVSQIFRREDDPEEFTGESQERYQASGKYIGAGSGIYSARGHLAKAAILKEEGQVNEAVTELQKVKQIEATRDKVYFTSYRRLIEEKIKSKKFSDADRFLERYEEMLGNHSEPHYALVSYRPFKELSDMKRIIAIGLEKGTDALKHTLVGDWFDFHEHFERPLNVMKFAYQEFITYITELDGGVVTKKNLPEIKKYMATDSASPLNPEDFVSVQKIEEIARVMKKQISLDSVKHFVRSTISYPFEDYNKVLDSFLDSDLSKKWKEAKVEFGHSKPDAIQEAMEFAIRELDHANVYLTTEKMENNCRFYKNSKGEMVDEKDIAMEFYGKAGFTGTMLPYNIFAVIYILLFWDVIYTPAQVSADEDWEYQEDETLVDLPGDFYQEGFQQRRSEFFLAREAELYEADLMEECRTKISDHGERNCPILEGIGWDKIDLDSIERVIESFERKKLIDFLQLLANNFRLFKAIPDPYLWSQKDAEGRFIQIKHEDEHYSENEVFWILNFRYNMEIPVEIFSILKTSKS